MITFWLQVAVTVCLICFGLLSLAVARATANGNPYYHAAWVLTGTAFTTHGLDKSIQNVFGFAAMDAGNSSRLMEQYLAWAPVFNHSRTFLLFGFCGAMVALALRKEPLTRGFWTWAYTAMAVGLLVGVLAGVAEGTLVAAKHYTEVLKWDAVELVLLLSALFSLLLADRVDRHLWSALAVYGFSLALSTSWLGVFANWDMPETWDLPTWSMQGVRLFLRIIMVAFVLRRLMQAGRGKPGRGLVDSFSMRPSLAG